MIKNLLKMFNTTLYVQIWQDRIKVTDIKTNAVFDQKPLVQIETKSNGVKFVTAIGNQAMVNVVNPFLHPRTLLNDFYVAEKLLQKIVIQLIGKKFISPIPAIIIHPMEKTEGGLTMIEIRAFEELAQGVGARKSVVYQGAEMSISEINFEQLIDTQKNNSWFVKW